uniref:Dynein heavy chain tail domain-containing protein n=1 Tax=Salarias fasciatus TaxID=181472 RepID=A0A672JPG1_SALFA
MVLPAGGQNKAEEELDAEDEKRSSENVQTKLCIFADENSLHLPELDMEQGVDILLANPETIEKLEQCVMNWQTQITIVIEEQQKKQPQAPGPLAEIVLWQERADAVNALSEQLRQPAVKKILEVMTRADSSIVHTLEGTVAELTKYRSECDDNFRFLKTMERHFKNLADGANLGVILENIRPLMDSLQTVWMISYHFQSGDRMVPLMERIAWQLCERVAQAIDVHTLFKYVNKKEATSQVYEAKQVLDQWKSSYFDVRADIEKLGWNQRWEFDRKRLFERSDYMASVCQDLYNVLQILEEFSNFFGPELKRVTGEAKLIDEILGRVDRLVSPFEQIIFNPFNILKMSSWKTVIQDFNTSVQVGAIDGEAITFIDQSFKTLRSSSTAFEILMKFKHVRCREAIKNHLMKKSDDILAQYIKEVDAIAEIFKKEKDKPVLSKFETPVAGAIKWARFLADRIKQPILSFLKAPELLGSDHTKTAKDKYMELAVQLKEYEKKTYECWFAETEHNLPLLMKKTLLANTTSDNPVQAEVVYIFSHHLFIRGIISETNDLVPLGYSVPGQAQHVALQELNFCRYVDDLKKIVSRYHCVIDGLSEAHFIMLAPQIEAVQKELNYGIPDFLSQAFEAVSKFETLFSHIHRNEKEIDSKLQAMVAASLLKIPSPDKSNNLPGVKEFCERIEQERVKTVNLLVRKYADIGFLITKIEHLVLETSSGKAKVMAEYYSYWERKVLDSLIKMVLRNVQALNMALTGSTALFQVDVILSAPKIVLQPKSSDVYSLIMQCVRDCVESTKQFVRWMHGTCIECPPVRVGNEDEFVTFTFCSDVWQHPQINESATSVSQNMQQLLLSVDRYLPHWKRHRALWEKNRTIVNEKFAAKRPSCVMYDDKLQFLTGIQQELMLEPHFRKEHIICLNLEPLILTVWETAQSWITSLGGFLNKPAKEDLFNLRDELTVLYHSRPFMYLCHC